MAIFINENTKVLVQGMTGSEGTKHTARMIKSGTKIVGGVTPGKGGQSVEIEGVTLPVFNRGYHIITDIVQGALPPLPKMAILHLFIQHTSAALTINENADPSVRVDFENIFNRIVPENEPYYTHTYEGSDDMPAHIKAAMIGHSIQIPISNHQFNLGTWQSIYLCEFRNNGGRRKLVASIYS
mgnify:CR=1 FL=1